jgi:hypothetical protein
VLDPAAVSVETGLADVITLQRRRQARVSAYDEESFFVDTLSVPVGPRRGGIGTDLDHRLDQAGDRGLRVLRHAAVAADASRG